MTPMSETGAQSGLDLLMRECASCREENASACRLSGQWDSIQSELKSLTSRIETLQGLASFPEGNPDPAFRVSRDGVVLYANDAAQPVLQEWGTTVGERAPGKIAAIIRDSLTTGKRMRLEIIAGRKRFELIAAPVAERDYVNLYGRNVTRRRAEEARLLDLMRRQQAMLDNIPDIVWLKDRDGRYIIVNEACARTRGLHPPDFVGKTDMDVWPKDLADKYKQDDLEVMRTGRRKQIDEHLEVSGDRGRICIETIKTPVYDEQGNLVGTAGVARDVTERINLHQQLTQSQKLEAIGRLAAGIAHEINTPTQYIGDNMRFVSDSLDGVLGLVRRVNELLQAKISDAAFRAELAVAAGRIDLEFLASELPQAISQSLDGVQRVAHIVKAMKQFSHPGEEEKTQADINKALENTLTVSRNEWKYVAATNLELDPSLPPVLCHPADLNQVFLNIIINAAHAIGDVVHGTSQKGLITVSTRREGDWIEIRISDTGTGIPSEARERIFDPFFTTKPLGRGTGQGLSIARNIVVKKHNGTIDFQTAQGQGTTFIIRLPLGSQEGDVRE